jgi:predicted ATP-dependent endonuclease of OLD family
MRLKRVRISGFRSFPFCATYDGDSKQLDVTWGTGGSRICECELPHSAEHGAMLCAVIGANSTGKSNLLYALDTFFSSTSKLALDSYYNKSDAAPIVIELDLVEDVASFESLVAAQGFQDFADKHCWLEDDQYQLRTGSVWQTPDASSRVRYLRNQDGTIDKLSSTADKSIVLDHLLPVFRLVHADSSLLDQANPKKADLVQDLLDDVLEAAGTNGSRRRNVMVSIGRKLGELNDLLARDPGDKRWRHLTELEVEISASLRNVTPGEPRVMLDPTGSLPDVQGLLRNAVVKIDDGVELAFDRHGLGLQRSFVLALLKTWCDRISKKRGKRDYLFAIEEPEIYLHPHATRVMLETLQAIAERDLVLFTTHSSEFVNRVQLGNVLLMRKEQLASCLTLPDFSQLPYQSDLEKVNRYLEESKSDMLFARSVVLVEGQSELYAIPQFARRLSIDLDGHGVSVVATGSKSLFRVYHFILERFGIPHVILVDGDGARGATEAEFQRSPYNIPQNRIFVLDENFEVELARCLSDATLCRIVNVARRRLGKGNLRHNDILAAPAGKTREEHFEKRFKDLGKPLIGRVAGPMLSRAEIRSLEHVEELLRKAVEIA